MWKNIVDNLVSISLMNPELPVFVDLILKETLVKSPETLIKFILSKQEVYKDKLKCTIINGGIDYKITLVGITREQGIVFIAELSYLLQEDTEECKEGILTKNWLKNARGEGKYKKGDKVKLVENDPDPYWRARYGTIYTILGVNKNHLGYVEYLLEDELWSVWEDQIELV